MKRFLIIFALFLSIYLFGNTKDVSAESSLPVKSNVLVVVYYSGHNPIANFDYNSLISNIEVSIENASAFKKYSNPNNLNNIDYSMYQKIVLSKTAPQKGLNCDQYLPKIHSGQWTTQDWQTTSCWGSGTADYNAMISENNVCTLVNSKMIDEVWFLAFGYGGFWEANMTGANAYWTNGPIVYNTGCNRPTHLMGFNYELPYDYALHSFGHRVEGVARRFLFNEWNQFDTIGYSYSYGSSNPLPVNPSCGNVHLPPNGRLHYDYTNSIDYVSSDCMDWNVQHSGTRTLINCSTWGCSQMGYMMWWFQNIPGANNNLLKLDGTKFPNVWSLFLFSSDITVGNISKFLVSTTSGNAPLTVQFTDQTGFGATSWLWDFGDGYTSTQQHPSHTYTVPGTFSVSFEAIRGSRKLTEKKDYVITALQTGWSSWTSSISTGSEISFGSVGSKLYQSIRGNDGLVYTRESADGVNWNNWIVSGGSAGKITMVSFNNKLYQAVRDNQNTVWTRKTDGTAWDNWVQNGGSKYDVAMEILGGILIQSVTGNDGFTWTRRSLDGINWEAWQQSISSNGNVSLKTLGNVVVQSIRDSSNIIWTRTSSDGKNWTTWIKNGGTPTDISMQVFGGKLYQAVSGNDKLLYTRSSTNGIDWSSWVVNGGTECKISMQTYKGTQLYQSVRGNDGALWTRYTNDGINWSNWVRFGGTSIGITMFEYGGKLFQSVRGYDSLVYTRYLQN